MQELTPEDQRIIAEAIERHQKRLQNTEPPKKKPRHILEKQKLYHFTEEERATMPEKFLEFLRLQEYAIQKVKERIAELEGEDKQKYRGLLEHLYTGLRILEESLGHYKREGMEWLIEVLERFKKERRPGLGLSRGFGEFDCGDEVMDAVYAIEDYFRTM